MICYFAQASPYGVRIPAEVRDFSFFSKTSRSALGPTRPPVQWVLGFYPGGKAAGASS